MEDDLRRINKHKILLIIRKTRGDYMK